MPASVHRQLAQAQPNSERYFCSQIAQALILAMAFAVGCVNAFAQGSPDNVWSRDYSTGNATSVAYAPNGQTVVSGETDRASQLWSAANGGSAGRVVQGQIGCGTVNDVAYSPDSQIVATINGCTLKLWSVSTGVLIRTINSGGGANASNSHTSVAFSPDGQVVASSVSTAYGAGSVSLWRIADGALIRKMSGGGGTDLGFSPDGQIIASIGLSRGAGLTMWRVSDGSLLRSIPGVIQALAFSPDGVSVAAGGATGGEFDGDDTIEIYRVADGTLAQRLMRTGGVGSLAYTPDGAALLSAGYDPNQDNNGYTTETGVIRVWRLSDGVLLKTYDQNTGTNVVDLAVSPDGKFFAYGFGKTMALARMPDTSTQASVFSIDPKSATISCGGGEASINVFAPPGKSWTASSRVSWITIVSGSTGAGNGTVSYNVASNGCNAVPGSDLIQQGQIVVAEQSFIVNQKTAVAGPSPTPTPTPDSTPTPTPTPDSTPTPTPTPDSTPTPTPTPDSTPTPTPTPTPDASPSPSPVPPVILTVEHSDEAIAIDSVTWIRDPLSVTTPNNYFAPDGHTRVVLFAANLPSSEGAFAVTAEAEDAEHRTYPLLVEYVGPVSQFDWLSQVIVRLPDEISNAGEVWINIKVHGTASNKVTVRIRP